MSRASQYDDDDMDYVSSAMPSSQHGIIGKLTLHLYAYVKYSHFYFIPILTWMMRLKVRPEQIETFSGETSAILIAFIHYYIQNYL